MKNPELSTETMKALVAVNVELQMALRFITMAEALWSCRDKKGVNSRASDARRRIDKAVKIMASLNFTASDREESNEASA